LDINTNKLREINEGLSSKIDYPIMTVIGAGTGLGKVKLAYDSTLKKYVDVPSESGHMSLTIEGEEELRLTRFILKKRGIEEVEFEDILSGRGIEIYILS